MNEQRPPANWAIWIAHVQSEKWRTSYYRNSSKLGHFDDTGRPIPASDGRAVNTQSITMGIGELLITAISSTFIAQQFDIPADAKRHVRQIWPITSGHLWPPGTIFTTSAADRFADALSRFISALPSFPSESG